MLPSRISSVAVSIHVVPNLRHRACPPLSSPLTLSAIPNIPERRYSLRLVVIPCQYFSSPLPSFLPISPSTLSHISSSAVPHILSRRIYPCCPVYPPPFPSAAIFNTDLVCHPYYPVSPPRLNCYPRVSLLRSLLHYLPSFRVICRRFLSTLYDRIFSSLFVFLYYTSCSL